MSVLLEDKRLKKEHYCCLFRTQRNCDGREETSSAEWGGGEVPSLVIFLSRFFFFFQPRYGVPSSGLYELRNWNRPTIEECSFTVIVREGNFLTYERPETSSHPLLRYQFMKVQNFCLPSLSQRTMSINCFTKSVLEFPCFRTNDY